MGLYKKSESGFAVAWIVVYVVVIGNLRANLGDTSVAGLIALVAFAALSVAFMRRTDTLGKYGVSVAPANARRCLYFVPLALLPLANLIHFEPVTPGPDIFVAVMSMLLVGYVEEFVFRGLLFRAIEKENGPRPAIVVSALTFGIGHLVNLLAGQATLGTVLQVCYAVAIGFAFTLVFLRSGSLWPCIVCHGLINATGVVNAAAQGDGALVVGSLFLAVVAGGYAWYLWKADND